MQAPVSTAKGQELATKINAFKYMECSAMTQQGLKVRRCVGSVVVLCAHRFFSQDVFDTAVKSVLFPNKGTKKSGGGCALL